MKTVIRNIRYRIVPAGTSYDVLLHMNGTDGSKTFTDESGKVWSAYGTAPSWVDPEIDTAQSKFGSASGLFPTDIVTPSYIFTPAHSAFNLSDHKWAWGFWVRLDSILSNMTIGQVDLDTDYFYINVSPGTIQCVCSAPWSFGTSPTISTGAWHYIEVARNGDTPLIFLDGTSQSVAELEPIAGTTAPDLSKNFCIGYVLDGGWIDEVAFSNGTVFHTSNFSVPTGEYTYGSGEAYRITTALDNRIVADLYTYEETKMLHAVKDTLILNTRTQ